MNYVIKPRAQQKIPDKRYFAYTFDGETVTVVDACHAQNMH